MAAAQAWRIALQRRALADGPGLMEPEHQWRPHCRMLRAYTALSSLCPAHLLNLKSALESTMHMAHSRVDVTDSILIRGGPQSR